MSIPFSKFHGFGNDYIVVERDDLPDGAELSGLTRRMCDRHTGVGGDGIALLEKLDGKEADYDCRIINPDGSEAGFSGNGTRCAVAYLHHRRLWSARDLKLRTRSGIKNYELLEASGHTYWFLAELGRPHSFRELGTEVAGLELAHPAVSLDVGNPVCVIFADDLERLDWRAAGALLENHTALFPERTNVVFVRVVNAENVEIRIWERGAGETSSSGTCSIAAAVAAAHTGRTGRRVSVRAPGGTTEAVWREDDEEMLIKGRADLAFSGEWFGA